MSDLVRYEEMRVSVERCARIDEAAEMRDKAAALSAYARQRDDTDLDVWMSEIKLRASVRIGELVRELDVSPQASGGRHPTTGTPTKGEALADAGLSKSTAHRYEELTGGRDEQAQKAGKAAAEAYFAKSRQDRKPASMDGLRAAVKEAVVATVGPKPTPVQRDQTPHDPNVRVWVEWTAAIKHLFENRPNFEALSAITPGLGPQVLGEAHVALRNIADWIDELEKRYERKVA